MKNEVSYYGAKEIPSNHSEIGSREISSASRVGEFGFNIRHWPESWKCATIERSTLNSESEHIWKSLRYNEQSGDRIGGSRFLNES